MATDRTENQKQEREEPTRDGTLKEWRGLVTEPAATNDIVRDGTLKEARTAVVGKLENADVTRDGTLKESRAIDAGRSVQPD
jgi:hypothetical protein